VKNATNDMLVTEFSMRNSRVVEITGCGPKNITGCGGDGEESNRERI
jgi:hypothetical protein